MAEQERFDPRLESISDYDNRRQLLQPEQPAGSALDIADDASMVSAYSVAGSSTAPLTLGDNWSIVSRTVCSVSPHTKTVLAGRFCRRSME
jgi:hypothetical protein